MVLLSYSEKGGCVFALVDTYSNTPGWAKKLIQKVLQAEGIDRIQITWSRTTSSNTGGTAWPFAPLPRIEVYVHAAPLIHQRDVLIHELAHIIREKDRVYQSRHPWHDQEFYRILFYWQSKVGNFYYSALQEIEYKPRGARKALASLGIDHTRIVPKARYRFSVEESEVLKKLKKNVLPYEKGWSTIDVDIDMI